MSTLTSAQLHVKRSSTRLHAPPGGASSLSFGCGGLGTAEPAEGAPSKDESAYARPCSGRYAPSTASTDNNYGNSSGGGYPGYSTLQPDSGSYNNYAPPQQSYQQQPYQHQAPYNSNTQGGFNYGNSSNQAYPNNNNDGFQGGRPPSSSPSFRSSIRTSSSSSYWGSQPPLTSSKRDQNWEKKRRLWLARKNSGNGGNNYGDRPPSSSSTWGGGLPAPGMLDDSIAPPSPLSKFMHQHAQQQQQAPPQTPGVEFQRLGTASSIRSSSNSYMHQPYPPPPQQQQYPGPIQMPGTGYSSGGASFSRAGLSTASSTASSTVSSRRQPPGGQCQWALG